MNNYLNLASIREAFTNYLIMHHFFLRSDAELTSSDFPDPYKNPYIITEFNGFVEIDGEKYECNSCTTSFDMFMSFEPDAPPFNFNIYYRCSDIPNNSVGEYRASHKLFSIIEN